MSVCLIYKATLVSNCCRLPPGEANGLTKPFGFVTPTCNALHAAAGESSFKKERVLKRSNSKDCRKMGAKKLILRRNNPIVLQFPLEIN